MPLLASYVHIRLSRFNRTLFFMTVLGPPFPIFPSFFIAPLYPVLCLDLKFWYHSHIWCFFPVILICSYYLRPVFPCCLLWLTAWPSSFLASVEKYDCEPLAYEVKSKNELMLNLNHPNKKCFLVFCFEEIKSSNELTFFFLWHWGLNSGPFTC
jgi:hypothetical protein